jgi:hypothetical protein
MWGGGRGIGHAFNLSGYRSAKYTADASRNTRNPPSGMRCGLRGLLGMCSRALLEMCSGALLGMLVGMCARCLQRGTIPLGGGEGLS